MQIDIPQLRNIISEFQRIQAALHDPSRPFAASETLITASIATNFTSGGRPTWPPRRHSYPHPPLLKTRRLFHSIGEIRRQTAQQLELGTAVEYAGYQQDGTSRIDPRPFVMFQDEDCDAIQQVFQTWLDDLIR